MNPIIIILLGMALCVDVRFAGALLALVGVFGLLTSV